MSILSAAALVVAARAGSVLPLLSDGQFCALIQRNASAMSAQSFPQAKFGVVKADCHARRVKAEIEVALKGEEFDSYVDRFVTAARNGVCNLTDPTTKAFTDRGWKFDYTFVGTDGRVVPHLLTC
jgi:hypothetical protein